MEDQAEYGFVLMSSAVTSWQTSAPYSAPNSRKSPRHSFFSSLNSTYVIPLVPLYCIGNSLSVGKETLTQQSMFIGAPLPSTRTRLELFYQDFSDDEPEVHRKAAFAVGVLVEQTQSISQLNTCTCSPPSLTLRGPMRGTHCKVERASLRRRRRLSHDSEPGSVPHPTAPYRTPAAVHWVPS